MPASTLGSFQGKGCGDESVGVFSGGGGCGVFLAACGGSEPGVVATPKETVTAIPVPGETATLSPSPSTPEEQAAELAQAKYMEFSAMEDEALRDPVNFDIRDLDEVAVPLWKNRTAEMLNGMVNAGEHMVGEAKVTLISDLQVDLTIDLTANPPVPARVTFIRCIDVTDFRTVDEAGQDVTPASRLDQAADRIEMFNYSYPDEDQWRYGGETPVEGVDCP